MSNLEKLMRAATEHPAESPDALEQTMRRVRRRERQRRVLSAALALGVFAGAGALLWQAFAPLGRRAQEQPRGPAAQPTPAISPLPASALSPEITAIIPLGDLGQMSSLVSGLGSVWVAGFNEDGSFVLRIDSRTNEVIAKIPTPAPVVEWESGGGGLAISRGSLWAAGDEGGSAVLQRIDPATNTLVQTVDLGRGIGADIAVDDTAGWVLIMGGPEKSRVVRVDPATGIVEAVIPLDFGWARRILSTSGGIWALGRLDPVYGFHIGELYMTLIDPATNQVVESFPASFSPAATDGEVLWAPVQDRPGAVVGLDGGTGRPIGEPSPIGGLIGNDLAVGAGGLWFISYEKGSDRPLLLKRLNPHTGTVDVSTEGSPSGRDIAVSSESVWLLGYDGTLIAIDLF